MTRTLQAVFLVTLIGFVGYVGLKNWTPAKAPRIPAPVTALSPTQAKRFVAPGDYFLLERIVIPSKDGVAGYPPGTKVRLLKKKGPSWHVTDGEAEFDLQPAQLTKNVAVADILAEQYDSEVSAAVDADLMDGQTPETASIFSRRNLRSPAAAATAPTKGSQMQYTSRLDDAPYDQKRAVSHGPVIYYTP